MFTHSKTHLQKSSHHATQTFFGRGSAIQPSALFFDQVSSPPVIQKKCAGCEAEEEVTLQAKVAPGHTPILGVTTHAKIQSLKGGGQPLSPSTRAFFEPCFASGLSQVRVHTDSKAAETARSINAKAFTAGRDIVFGAGQHQPQTIEGKKLLAHELTHVVQQKNSNGSAGAKQIRRSPMETQALCPIYYKYDTSINVGNYNCAGLAHRTYDKKNRTVTKAALFSLSGGVCLPCNKSCSYNGYVKHWLWEYNLHWEDSAGKKLGGPAPDFHTVAGVTDLKGNDPDDVYSKNGKRPVYGPGLGPSFKPQAREQDRINDPNEKLIPNQYKVRSGMRENCYCVPCVMPPSKEKLKKEGKL